MPGLCGAAAAADHRRLRRRGLAAACVLVRRRSGAASRRRVCCTSQEDTGIPRTISLVYLCGDSTGAGNAATLPVQTVFVVPVGRNRFPQTPKGVCGFFMLPSATALLRNAFRRHPDAVPDDSAVGPAFRFFTASRKTAVRVGIGALFLSAVPFRNRSPLLPPPSSRIGKSRRGQIHACPEKPLPR